MIHTELHAAGIDDERLRESYRYCRRLNAQHGRTYFLATRLLAPSQRPAVHALYGFARYADDILDDLDSTATVAEREARLDTLSAKFFSGTADPSEPVLPAVLHTARTYRIPLNLFDEFLTSMRMDLTVTDYPDRAALNRYMRGSAEVIGLQMLPILEPVAPGAEAGAKIAGVVRVGPADHGAKPARRGDLAQAAGVSPGLLRHHYGSKDALRVACDEYVLQALRQLNAQLLAGPRLVHGLARDGRFFPVFGVLGARTGTPARVRPPWRSSGTTRTKARPA